MNTDNLALHIWHSSAPKIGLDDVDAVLTALNARGYRLEPEGSPGECVSTGQWIILGKEIARTTPVCLDDVLIVFTAICHLKIQLNKPVKKAA